MAVFGPCSLTVHRILLSALMLFSISSFIVVLLYFNQDHVPAIWREYLYPAEAWLRSRSASEALMERCGPPQIPVWHDSALKYLEQVSVNCASETDQSVKLSGWPAFSIRQGHWLQQQVNVDQLGFLCSYRPFSGVTPFNNSYSEVWHNITLPNTEIPAGMDFIEVVCRDKKNKSAVAYRDAFALVHPQKANNLPLNPISSSHLKVIIVGLDATSRLNFKRFMPRASELLLKELGAVDLEEYSVVGTGTVKNNMALLTGLSFGEMEQHCKTAGGSTCRRRFIWKEFAKRGYITSLSEDYSTWINRYDYIKEAIVNDTPTTYYNRALEYHFDPEREVKYCYGPRVTFQVLLEFIESVSQVAQTLRKPYFQMCWSGKFTHNHHNSLVIAEPPLLQFLQNFKNSGAWNDTMLLVLADHGQGMNGFYDTPEGPHEYKLPLAYVVLPPWFPQRYPDKWANLKANARQLVTPYDVHKTLQDVLEMSSAGSKMQIRRNASARRRPGISLFDKIPPRKCMEAGISLKFCRKCYPDIALSESDPLVQFAADVIMKEVKAQVKGWEHNCTNQTVKEIQTAFKRDPRDVARELCNIYGYSDMGHNYANSRDQLFNISCNIELETVDLVDVKLVTNSNGQVNATYQGEVFLRRSRDDGQILKTKIMDTYPYTDAERVKRVDEYKHTGACVPDEKQPYCICKSNETAEIY